MRQIPRRAGTLDIAVEENLLRKFKEELIKGLTLKLWHKIEDEYINSQRAKTLLWVNTRRKQ